MCYRTSLSLSIVFALFQIQNTKNISEWFHCGNLVKGAALFCVTDTTNLKLHFGPAKKPVVNVCRLMTKASAISDSSRGVLNQWLKYFGHNECAEQQTIT
jgi:hypothetical protein